MKRIEGEKNGVLILEDIASLWHMSRLYSGKFVHCCKGNSLGRVLELSGVLNIQR